MFDKVFEIMMIFFKKSKLGILIFGWFCFKINVFHGKDGGVVCVKYIGVKIRHFYIYSKPFGVTIKVIANLTFFYFSLLLLFFIRIKIQQAVLIL